MRSRRHLRCPSSQEDLASITRRTAHLALLATLAELGYEVDPRVVDLALNDRTEQVSQFLGVAPRTALLNADDASALTLAETIAEAIRTTR